jgi:hypothetical protein
VREVSETQLNIFKSQFEKNQQFAAGKGNNRMIQSANSRKVYVYGDEYDDYAGPVVALASAVLCLVLGL